MYCPVPSRSRGVVKGETRTQAQFSLAHRAHSHSIPSHLLFIEEAGLSLCPSILSSANYWLVYQTDRKLTNVFLLRYKEVCNPGYDFNNGGFSGGTFHFTQVVWKASTVLGIGRAEGEEGGMKCAYIVGRYKPAGNMMGQFEENVLKGNFSATYCSTL